MAVQRPRELRRLRELADMTQRGLSRATGIDPALLSQIESGLLKASDSRIRRIRNVLLKAIEKRRARMDQALANGRASGDGNRSHSSAT